MQANSALGRITRSLCVAIVAATIAEANTRGGTIVAWGYNNDSAGNYAGQSSPPPGLTNLAMISAGGFHSLALNFDGSVVAWGDNGDGESSVPPGLSNVVGIAAGYFHTLALTSTGTVVAWGSNVSGETNIPSGLTNVVAIAAGDAIAGLMEITASHSPSLGR